MQFSNPKYLWLFLIYIPMIVWYIMKQRNSGASLELSTISAFKGMGRPARIYIRHLLFVLRLLVVGCLIIILCRPQLKDSWRSTTTEGTDIVVALDVSTSMLARDFEPDRLEAAKAVAANFISGRESDNIGLVIFAGESLTGVPMTVDRRQLLSYIGDISTDMIEDGTAIGDGIVTSLNRLKEGKAKSKSIILLTDGSNNTGIATPLMGAEVAKELGVRVYTIGIGTNGMAPYPMINAFGRIEYVPQQVVIDETTLKSIAETTGGKYFRATDNTTLEDVFREIDALEKTRMDVKHFSHTEDQYILWAILALAFFALELFLRYTVARTMP